MTTTTMDGLITRCQQWKLSEMKEVKLITRGIPRLRIQWSEQLSSRGVCISKEALLHLSNLSIMPQSGCDYSCIKRHELDSKLTLCYYGNVAKFTNYRNSRDGKLIDASFMVLSGKEFATFLQLLPRMKEELLTE